MTTLVLASTRADTLRSGYDLRVTRLCAMIPDELHLVVVPMYARPDRTPTIDTSTLFASVTECAPLLEGRLSPRRHLRLDDRHYLQRSSPTGFAAARGTMFDVMARRDVRRLVVFGEDIAELAADTGSHPTVLDVCDSAALAQNRAITYAAENGGRAVADVIDLHRVRRTERRLPQSFDVVTTVSEADTAEIVRLSGTADNVLTVPNGVDEAFLVPMPEPAQRRGVVFWGNLDFEPNATALSYFLADAWTPLLRDAGVEVEVIGANPPAWLVDVARREPLIRLAGYVSDLRAAVSRYPVMINPMQTGSGLKNKVLEAFGLGVVVVSTPRGIEAIPSTRDGEHLAVAEDGADFANAVLSLLADAPRRIRLRENANALLHDRYRWTVAGRGWQAMFGADGRVGMPDRPCVGVLES